MTKQVQYFDGIKFTQRPDGYLSARISGMEVLMHRYVWEYYNGPIPNGHIVHHKDENKANNDIENLDCLPNSAHSRYHGTHKSQERLEKDRANLKKAQEKAAEWHKSDAGREWAKKNARDLVERGLINIPTLYTCDNCGKQFIEPKRKAKHKFCCGACEQYFRRHNGLNNETRICVVCGKEFVTDKYGKTKTCSRSCGMKLAHINRPDNWRAKKESN